MNAVPWLPLTLRVPVLAVAVSFTIGSAFMAGAQTPAPNPSTAKPPVHRPEQSALNRVKQDERAQKALEESKAALKDSDRRLDAAAKEIQRLDKDALKNDPQKALKSIAEKLSPEDTAKLKEELKKAGKEFLDSDEAKRLLEEAKKKGGGKLDAVKKTQPAASPNSSGPPVPTTFDKIPAPVPLTVAALPPIPKRKIGSIVYGDKILFPPGKDPDAPGKALSPSNPLGRTYVVTGNALFKTPSLVLNADRIECLMDADQQGSNPFGKASPAPAAATTEKKERAPLSSETEASEDKEDAPFERMVATGRVQVVQLDKGVTTTGNADRMVYEKKTGRITLTGWPSVQKANQKLIAEREGSVIVLIPGQDNPYSLHCKLESLLDTKKKTEAAKLPSDKAAPRAQVVP